MCMRVCLVRASACLVRVRACVRACVCVRVCAYVRVYGCFVFICGLWVRRIWSRCMVFANIIAPETEPA